MENSKVVLQKTKNRSAKTSNTTVGYLFKGNEIRTPKIPACLHLL
jgi:hypothetical protein